MWYIRGCSLGSKVIMGMLGCMLEYVRLLLWEIRSCGKGISCAIRVCGNGT